MGFFVEYTRQNIPVKSRNSFLSKVRLTNRKLCSKMENVDPTFAGWGDVGGGRGYIIVTSRFHV